MNILLLNWRDMGHPKSGGAELVTLEHAKAWAQSGHSVTWLTSSYSGAISNEDYYGIRMIRRGGQFTVYLYVFYYLFMYGKSYDIIVDQIHGIPFFSKLFTRTPVIVYIHEIADEIWDYMFSYPFNVIGRFLETVYLRLYRQSVFWTIAPSTIKELVSRGIPAKNCHAIPNPVIVSDARFMPKPGTKKFPFPSYIFVSRVVKMKGIEEVIKAFSFIMQKQPDAQLNIVGGGEQAYIEQLKQMLQEYGVSSSVRFYGKVSEQEKLELMAKSHVLLHASVKEGWGLVVLEAAYAGTPSVVYNVPGLCDVVQNGKTGIVLQKNSPHEMARESVLLYLDGKRYKQFQKNARAWVASLTWKDVTKQSEQLLRHVISRQT